MAIKETRQLSPAQPKPAAAQFSHFPILCLRNLTLAAKAGSAAAAQDSTQVCQEVNQPHSSCSTLKVQILQNSQCSTVVQQSLFILEGAQNKSNPTPKDAKDETCWFWGWLGARQSTELRVAESREPASLPRSS